VKITQLGPGVKAAVCASAPGAEAETPRPTASDEPKLSKIIAFFAKLSSPRLFSWLHIEPDELIALTLDRSHRPGSASSASSIGVEKARPTMTILVAASRSVSSHSSMALNLRDGR
jgi:hypothetical protein